MKITVRHFLVLSIFATLVFAANAIAADIPKRSADIQRITVAELQTLQTSGETVIIIDTRRQNQWQQAKDKIPGAIRVTTRKELLKLEDGATPDTEIVTYCT